MRVFMSLRQFIAGGSLVRALVPVLAFLTAFIAGPGETKAQGLLDLFFGGGKKSAPPTVRRNPQRQNRGNYNLQRRIPLSTYEPRRRYLRSGDGDTGRGYDRPRRSYGGGGSYRTMCVRSCDGYYFPVSFGVGRSRFSRDARTCRSKCGDGASLYYMSKGASTKTMRALRGEPYAKTKTAFLFRKQKVKGCSCRAAPWEPAQIYRHKLYELNEPHERKLARLEGDIDFLAGITKKRRKVVQAEAAAKRLALKLSTGGQRGLQSPGRGRTTKDDGAITRAVAGGGVSVANYMSGGNRSARYRVAVYDYDRSQWRYRDRQDDGFRYRRTTVSSDARRGRVYRMRRRNKYARLGENRYSRPYRRPRAVRRPATAARIRRRRAKQAKPSFWGLSAKPKYRWPGD